MKRERISDFDRFTLATEPQEVSVDLYDDGRVLLWVGEYKAWLEDTDRDNLGDILGDPAVAKRFVGRPE